MHPNALQVPNTTVQFKESIDCHALYNLDVSSICASDTYGEGSVISSSESISCASSMSAPSALRKSKYSSYPYARTDISPHDKKKKKKKSPKKKKIPKENNGTNMLPPLNTSEMDDEDDDDDDSITDYGTYAHTRLFKPNQHSVVLPARQEGSVEVFTPQTTDSSRGRQAEKKHKDTTFTTDIISPLSQSSMSADSGRSKNGSKSGVILMRCSRRSLLFRNWREVIWTHSKPATFLFFRSLEDIVSYERNHSILNERVQKRLIKLSVDFDTTGCMKQKQLAREAEGDLIKNSPVYHELPEMAHIRPKTGLVRYIISELNSKYYKNRGITTLLHCFRLERINDMGTALIAKFASQDRSSVKGFRKALKKTIKKSKKAQCTSCKKQGYCYATAGTMSAMDCESSVGGASMASFSVATSCNSVTSRGSSVFSFGGDVSSANYRNKIRYRRKRR